METFQANSEQTTCANCGAAMEGGATLCGECAAAPGTRPDLAPRKINLDGTETGDQICNKCGTEIIDGKCTKCAREMPTHLL